MLGLIDTLTGQRPGTPALVAAPDPDEPTWDVRRPAAGRRFDGRTRRILSVAVVVAAVVNAGVAWAYWRIAEGGPERVTAGPAIELMLRGRSDFNRPLEPGGTGNLTVALTNDQNFPIRITAVRAAPGTVVADEEHRDSGCKSPAVTLSQQSFAVDWAVTRNNIGAFTIERGLTMAADVPRACLGASYTIPVQVSGHGVGD